MKAFSFQITEKEFIDAVLGHEKMSTLLALKVVQVFDPDKKK